MYITELVVFHSPILQHNFTNAVWELCFLLSDQDGKVIEHYHYLYEYIPRVSQPGTAVLDATSRLHGDKGQVMPIATWGW